MEAVITHLDYYNLKLKGADCASHIKLDHAEILADLPELLEILLPSGDRIRLGAVR
jgi:hypothetical protein